MNTPTHRPRLLATAALLLACCLPACGNQMVAWPYDDDTSGGPPVEVYEFTATAASVPAPDYTLDLDELLVLLDADSLVHSVTGAACLTPGAVPAQTFVVTQAAALDSYSKLDAAYLAAPPAPLTDTIPGAAFTLVGSDLSKPKSRTLILANSDDGVRAYQAFEILFDAAP
jgi:hypothetical protein